MLRNVFWKTLRDQRWALLGWGSGVLLLVVAISAVWPTMRDMPNLDEFLANYPETLRDLFNLEAVTTAGGFMNAELFTLMLPLLFIVFGISRGARMVAGEEESGTLEVLLLTPVSPVRLVLHKAAALTVAVLALGLVVFVSLWACTGIFAMTIPVADIAVGSVAMVLLGLEFGLLALSVGAATGRRAAALGVAGTAAAAAYLLYVLGLLVQDLEPWRPLSPFHQALADGPLGADLPVSAGWLVVATVVFVVAALPVFDRRDIRSR